MKKFIFSDLVPLLLCLESLVLQQGADSSMVQGKLFKCLLLLLISKALKISAAVDNQTSFTHFKGRHKRESGRSQFASRDKDNGKSTTLLTAD